MTWGQIFQGVGFLVAAFALALAAISKGPQ